MKGFPSCRSTRREKGCWASIEVICRTDDWEPSLWIIFQLEKKKNPSCSTEIFHEKNFHSYWEPKGCNELREELLPSAFAAGSGEEGWWGRQSVRKGFSRKPEQCFLSIEGPACRMLRRKLLCKILLLVEKALCWFFFPPFISWFRTFENSFFFSSGINLHFLPSSNSVFSSLGMHSSNLTLKNGISFKWRLLPISK